MGPLPVPVTGLTVQDRFVCTSKDAKSKPDSRPPQVMRLELADGVLEDIVKSKEVYLSFGKAVVSSSHQRWHCQSWFGLTPAPGSSLWQEISPARDSTTIVLGRALQSVGRQNK